MSDDLIYQINHSSLNDLIYHLEKCDDYFIPKLSSRVNIRLFSEKILKNAVRFEAWDKNLLIGLVSAYYNDFQNRKAYINNVSVLPAYQKRGIAKNLLNMCFDYGRYNNFRDIFLEVNSNNHSALNLYKNFGFYNTSRDKEFLIMRKQLG